MVNVIATSELVIKVYFEHSQIVCNIVCVCVCRGTCAVRAGCSPVSAPVCAKHKGLSETCLIVCRSEGHFHNDSSDPSHSALGTVLSKQTDRQRDRQMPLNRSQLEWPRRMKQY